MHHRLASGAGVGPGIDSPPAAPAAPRSQKPLADQSRQRTVKGERGVMQFYRLRMQGTLLTGILLISADLDRARGVVPIVVYSPHDPYP
ncbi:MULTISPECIES: hypothetical protein [Pseudomonas]|uniref:Uncharacterized protein n=1 Tax=Pseudomonas reactans TaxID=117680 RepID=A0A7Y8KGQ6_9PSED|nr:hypothetical protein [Pseudomonas reactans]NWE88378.1 hypothetical protein [Pseudomonas reactans]